jgi:3-methylcrotonyl-CoA carboxylase alpha subunit
MFGRLLIANRGEIACRIIRTCQRLGIHTIAVHSEIDAGARHVRLADEAANLGGERPADSYLLIERIIETARERRADAIHPGYGFLSENALFAGACEAAGIVFVGPGARTIRQMGSKSRARHIMQEAGVPVVPGYDGRKQTDATLLAAAREIGFPVLLKAAAGGGGKGMRIVREEAAWETALAGARRESMAAFGDDQMLVERYVQRPRHIEVQICADTHGAIVHLFERECSVQRRHQKIIEEAPSPSVDDALRTRLCAAAVAAARAVDYVNAGTVEFLLDPDGGFYFMEMNTRLQVEHPVTEAITGVDLVEWQLRIAAGEPLPLAQDDIARHGHSIEARLYAENPFNDFVPSSGRIGRFLHPVGALDLRVDSGVEDGDLVSVHYDPMLAKIIVWGDDRAAAIGRARHALARTMLTGPTTNLALLRAITGHPHFTANRIDTSYLDSHLDDLLGDLPAAHDLALIAAACTARHDAADRPSDGDPYSPWRAGDGWRLGGGGVRMRFADMCGERYEVEISGPLDDCRVRLGGREHRVASARLDADHLELRVDADEFQATVLADGEAYFVGLDVGGYELKRLPLFASDERHGEEDAHPGAPMPGRIVAVYVEEGETVEPGQALLVMEGMKMEYTLSAPVGGTIRRILHGPGEMVEAETRLIDIEPAESAPS